MEARGWSKITKKNIPAIFVNSLNVNVSFTTIAHTQYVRITICFVSKVAGGGGEFNKDRKNFNNICKMWASFTTKQLSLQNLVGINNWFMI